ncbi:uncharacterized protein LOC112023458 isoform X2 [Quercus suber]|uniref:uncharacterized protein LOC112023458 isoform X2 n=2 Tax=Quercus suber TaxID=58331 RepID=UPI0032DF1861
MIGIYKKIQRHFNFFSQIWCCLQVILVRRMLNSSKVLPVLNLLKQLFWEIMMPGILNSFLERGRMEFNFSLSGHMSCLNCYFVIISLGEEHVAYQHLDFPLIKVSIVGGRPFSSGGEQLFRKKLLSARYGVQDMDGSARRIYNAALGTPEDHFVILLAHNGPTGLGSNLNDICGKDWVFGGGDHGDPDLEQAISLLKETGKSCVPLVVFGHMHKELAYRKGLRKMIVVGDDNTIYLNGAIVPRVKRLNNEQGTGNRSFMNDETPVLTPESEGTMRAFTLVEILDGRVEKITESWVSVVGDNTTLAEEQLLFKRGG